MSPCFQRPWRCTAALGAPAATILRDMPIRPVNPSPRPAARAAARTRLASASPVSPNTPVVPLGSYWSDLRQGPGCDAGNQQAAARTRLASASPVSPNTPVVPLGSYWSDLRQGPGCDAGNQQAAARTRLASASPVSPNTPVVPVGSYWSDLRQGPGCGAGGSGSDPVGQRLSGESEHPSCTAWVLLV